ncbi:MULTISPECIES: 2-keto-4-pentenoate hydratase [Pseudomonas]|uniref:2-keto-4-pentenoate hydratase n=1 Tax=Pseudomonas TaxID=286 RepID=UPI001BE5447C|nr:MULTISPECIES: 2-keto-4-pentenoate hydratase [Pseudomonas]MBT2340003.1 2-keto-4-pentenoate hydratase [Pseudomonas fluorescens]MCD4527879.1 2-keto-4-pentenoate hydratase [Pseudomonas sp. C3-2018]
MRQSDELLVQLHRATLAAQALPALSPQAFDLPAGYAMQREALRQRQARGEQLRGWKVAFAGSAAQNRMGIHEPVLGALTDVMAVEPGSSVDLTSLIQPKLEIELACFLGRTLAPGDYSDEQILACVCAVAPAFEIADCRWQDWSFGAGAFLADNAAAALYCVGPRIELEPGQIPHVSYCLARDGVACGSGDTQAREDTPQVNVCWLIRRLLADGQRLEAGQVVLSGALLPPMDIQPAEYRLHMLGTELALVFQADAGAV